MSFSTIQEPKASGSRQEGPLATPGSPECHTWHLGPDQPSGASWDPVPCNFSAAWPEKLRDLGLLSQMDTELLYWQRLRDTQVNDESFTKQGPHHPRTERTWAISVSKVPPQYKTEKTQKQTYPSLGWKGFSNLLFYIPFNFLIFKSKKLKGSNKPLSFPIPPPPHKSQKAIIFVVSDKVKVIWPWSLRAYTKDKNHQGKKGQTQAQGDFSRVVPAPCSHPWVPPSIPQLHHCRTKFSPHKHRENQSLFFLAGGRGLSFLFSYAPGILFLQSEFVFYKQCLLVWPFQNFSLDNFSGCSVPYLIPVLLPFWQTLNIS